LFAVWFLIARSENTSSAVDLSRQRDDDDDVRRLQRQELERIQELMSCTAASHQLDPEPPADEPAVLEDRLMEDSQQVDDEQDQLNEEECERDKTDEHTAVEDDKVECESYSESQNAQRTVDEKDRQSWQQSDTDQQDISDPLAVNSPVPESALQTLDDKRQTEERQSTDRQRTQQVQMQMKAATEKKQQQVAVVHAHERSQSRAENPALRRIQRQEMMMMSRQGTVESHLSIDSTTASSHQLSQASLQWQQTDASALQQQYEQLRYQLQQQAELQRSQLEREYQLRGEQMKQEMMLQWRYLTQQHQGHVTSGHLFADVTSLCGFATTPFSADVSAQPANALLTGDEQRCGCDDVIHSTDQGRVPVNARRRQNSPAVVDVISHSRGRSGGGGGRGSWPGRDGALCRIIVGDRPATVDSVNEDEPRDWAVCPTCGRRQYSTSDDGKNVVKPTRHDVFTPSLIEASSSLTVHLLTQRLPD